MSDTQDHDQTRFVRAPGSRPDSEVATGGTAEGRESLNTVDFDVTSGFGDEAAAADEGFIDITAGADEAAADAVLDLTRASEPVVDTIPVGSPSVPSPAVAPTPTPNPTPAPAPTPMPIQAPDAAGGGKLIVIGVVIAVIALVTWIVLR